MIDKLKKLPKKYRDILAKTAVAAQESGVKVYLVGGVVRDLLLGKPNFDLDVVVEGDAIALAKRISEKFSLDFKKHHSFGTATVYFDDIKIDFATSRRETYVHNGALPRVDPASLKEDLFRRDFTINSMAVSLNKADYGLLIDPYQGSVDLKNKIVRVLHDKSFFDDPTRILRAIRFQERFSFKLEAQTAKWMKQALASDVLGCVNPHRWRDEITLILKEEDPLKPLKRLNSLVFLSFIDKKIKLGAVEFKLLRRVKESIRFYNRSFPGHREIDAWLLYFAVILNKLSAVETAQLCHKFGFKKGETIRLVSIKQNERAIKELSGSIKPSRIFSLIDQLSYETMIFYYACSANKYLRRNISYYINKLSHLRLKIKGEDLRRIGLSPQELYGKVLTKLLEEKMDKNIADKAQELALAVKIMDKLKHC
jgi:tRNA nucleotidyltransferase (CCA-adding enzyme)